MTLFVRSRWHFLIALYCGLHCTAAVSLGQATADAAVAPTVAAKLIADAEANGDVLVLKGHMNGVLTAAYCVDGAKLITGSADRTARVWDANTGRELLKIEKTGWNGCYAAVREDGTRIVTTNIPYVKIWDASSGREILDLTGRVGLESHWPFPFHASMTRDGKQIVTASPPTRRAVGENVFKFKLRDVQTGDEVVTFEGQGYWPNVSAFSPDGSRLITGCQTADDTAKLWDCKTGMEVFTFKGHGGSVWSVGFSNDGQRLATAGVDRIVHLWDSKTGEKLLTLKGHQKVVTAISFSSRNSILLTASADHTVRVWNLRSGRELFVLPCHTGNVTSVAMSPDGRHFATASWDQTARIWNLESLCKSVGCELPE